MSSGEGPLGPGLRRRLREENRLRYFPSTKILWNLNSVAGLIKTPSFGIRCRATNSMVKPSTNRSRARRLGARRLERLLMSNWCFRSRDSAATARTPPGRNNFAAVTSRWITRIRSSRTARSYHGGQRAQSCNGSTNRSYYEFATHRIAVVSVASPR